MTQVEQIKAEIERRMKNNQQDTTESGEGAFFEDKELLSFINSIPAEQANDVEEEINDYFERHIEICNDNTLKCGGEEFDAYDLLNVIEHFIQWQKEQMMKSAIEGGYIKRNRYTKENVLNGFSVTCDAIQKFKDGDKVKIIIIKEDEK